MFLIPENLGIDLKIIKIELIVSDLWPFIGFVGHLGRHFEKNTFLVLRFWLNYSMLKFTLNPNRIHWKTFCSKFLGVKLTICMPYIVEIFAVLLLKRLYLWRPNRSTSDDFWAWHRPALDSACPKMVKTIEKMLLTQIVPWVSIFSNPDWSNKNSKEKS